MTERLKQAIKLVEQLDPAIQDMIAAIIEEQLEEEEWDDLVSSPQSKNFLKKLVAEGRKEHAKGHSEEITGETFG